MLFLKNVLFTLFVPGTVAVYIPYRITEQRVFASGPMLLVAVALFAVGAAIYLWCVWDFAAFGRGTPAPIDAPIRLVVRGLYRYTRNPMYVGVLAVIVGWAALFQAASVLVYAIGVAACFHLFVVLYEERRLAQLFGAEYAEYRVRVNRWLPRVRFQRAR
jgi:protein-S-isoprenylcysteine O-methyltransferase Ste14